MHRALAIDVLACAYCEGRLRPIATLHDPAVIPKLLAHLGMAPQGQAPAPQLAPARPDRLLAGAPDGAMGADPADPPFRFICRLTAAARAH